MTRIGRKLIFLFAVAVVVPACGGGGSSGSGLLSGLVILGTGGTGTSGPGGGGASVTIRGKTGSDIRILTSGAIDTAFQVPSEAPFMGSNPRTISGSVTYSIGPAGLTSLPLGATSILGDDALTPATGLWVQPGAVLQIPCVLPGGVALNTGTALIFPDGVLIEGTFTMGYQDLLVPGNGASPNAGSLLISAQEAVVRAGALLSASGRLSGFGTGGTGGAIQFQTTGAIAIAGAIAVDGASGTTGGAGGVVRLTSSTSGVLSSGSISASGGAGSAGSGGAAGLIDLLGSLVSSNHGPVLSSGSVRVRGGDGTSQGGLGGTLNLIAISNGAVVSSGPLDVSGGNATLSGNGGDGGGASISANGGSVRITGSILARGGDGAGAAGAGGSSNLVQVSFQSGAPVLGVENEGGLFLGAPIDVRGGDGATGGQGGALDISGDTSNLGNNAQPGNDPIVLVGYSSITTSGGQGGTGGGPAGPIHVDQVIATTPTGAQALGGIRCESSLVMTGGAGLAGTGGGGSTLFLTVPSQLPMVPRSVTITGSVEASGGPGTTSGGSAGVISASDHFPVSFLGGIHASGGGGGTGVGGSGGSVTLQSDISASVFGLVSLAGGASTTGNGGTGGLFFLQSETSTESGGVSCRGGNSTTGTGGSGGSINIFSTQTTSILGGSFSVASGSGTAPGSAGLLSIDGIQSGPTVSF